MIISHYRSSREKSSPRPINNLSFIENIFSHTPYVPDINTIWKTGSVSLNNYTSYNNVIIKIVNVTDGGNNLYIDNILIGDPALGINSNVENINLFKIFPNPFTQNSQIRYLLKTSNSVIISVHDIYGKELQVLQNGQQLPGEYTLEIDPKTMKNSGVYFVKVQLGELQYFKKLIFIQ